jgi:hypothetical protein
MDPRNPGSRAVGWPQEVDEFSAVSGRGRPGVAMRQQLIPQREQG